VTNRPEPGAASSNLPIVINAPGGYSSTISYGAFRNRFKQVAIGPQGTETTIYVAGLLEKVTNAQGTHYRHYIQGGKGTAAIHSRTVGGSNATFYLHRDHLGSPELITNSSGGVLVRPSFAAYGERRDGADWDGPISSADLNTLAGISRRGFTGHEHLDAVGLIHMNGRVYEPVAGRFLSRDPFVDGVATSQGINGYAYVHNSPLSFVDPSGFNCEPLPGMSDEEAAAYISRCSGEFESSGWGPAYGGSSRWCVELGSNCRLLLSDRVGYGVDGNFDLGLTSGSASGWSEMPIGYETAVALSRYEQMVDRTIRIARFGNRTPVVQEGDAVLVTASRDGGAERVSVIGSLFDTLRFNSDYGAAVRGSAVGLAAGIEARVTARDLIAVGTLAGVDPSHVRFGKLGGVNAGPYFRWTILGDSPIGAHIDDGLCAFVICFGSTVANDGRTASFYVQVSAGLGPYAVQHSSEQGIFRLIDQASCRPGYPWC
jgi:RHS repeat-associated protein